MARDDLTKDFIIAAHGNMEKVLAMLAADPSLALVSFEWRPGDTEDALQAAGHVGHRAIAEHMLGLGAPMTVYAAAALGRRDEVLRFLTADPALATRHGVHGISLMWHAALGGDVDIAEMVRENGGEVTSGTLHAAVSKSHVPMLRWLRDRGATDLSAPDFRGVSVHEAAKASGNREIIAALEGG